MCADIHVNVLCLSTKKKKLRRESLFLTSPLRPHTFVLSGDFSRDLSGDSTWSLFIPGDNKNNNSRTFEIYAMRIAEIMGTCVCSHLRASHIYIKPRSTSVVDCKEEQL